MNEKKYPVKCWEYFHCDKKECPSYHSADLRCWLQSGTYCYNKIQGTWLEKMEACINCHVFEENLSEKDWKDTLKLISNQFKNIRGKLEKEQEDLKNAQKKLMEFKVTSVYLLRELDRKSNELIAERNNLEKKVEERTKELQYAQEKLFQSTKVAALSRFSSGIAHEINNPLGAIINYLRTVLANPDIKGEIKGYLELTLKGLFRIENIVKQILSYSSHKKLESVNINQLISETMNFAQHKLSKKNVDLKLNFNNLLPHIFIDSSQIQQVFLNIINNAIDALDEKGRLTIETSFDDGKIHIKFIDNGKGIKEEDLEKIFTPFYTTKDVGSGTGLGLFISYNIIQIYQGTIEIKSKEGKGTAVTIVLPVSLNEGNHGK